DPGADDGLLRRGTHAAPVHVLQDRHRQREHLAVRSDYQSCRKLDLLPNSRGSELRIHFLRRRNSHVLTCTISDCFGKTSRRCAMACAAAASWTSSARSLIGLKPST